MYLKQLEIHGFKSFAEKTELGFVNGINAVVGPNGSGKSNIADAIRWVLGEQSVKTLRGSKMEDIIFAGSDRKKALGFAEVHLCIDNADKQIPVDFSEINVTRRMYRSGESEYFINKTHCRLKDIYELFMDTGIGRDGYSIIGQGKIDEILSNKSEDRRLVFEEAAGIVKYKTRKQEAEKKLENTKQNIVRIVDIIEEIEGQLEPMKEQAEIAKRYRKIAEELKVIEINLLVSNIEKYKNRLEQLRLEASGIQELIEEKTKRSAEDENKHSLLKKNLLAFEKQIADLNEEIHNEITLTEKREGEYRLLEEKINNYTNNINRLVKRDQELLKQHQDSKALVLEDERKLAELEQLFIELNLQIEEEARSFEHKFKSLMDMEVELDNQQQRFISLINMNSELKSKINSSNVFIDNIKKRIKQIQKETGLMESQCEEKRVQHQKIISEIDVCKGKIEKSKAQLEQLKNEQQAAASEISGLENGISAVKSERDSSTSRLKLLEEMERDHGGYSKTVKLLLTESSKIIKGYCGVIGEIIKVPKEYVTAVEMALGSSVQSMITENEEDAKLLIEYLKKTKGGRATFLPLSAVKPRFFNEKEKTCFKQEGVIGSAAELIEYDKRFDGVMKNLLGRIAVVEDIDSAIKLARRTNYDFRIVTLQGEIINAGGSMTGGSLNSSFSSVLSRKSEIEALTAKLDEKQQQLDTMTMRFTELKERYANIRIETDSKTTLLHAIQIELNNSNNKSDNLSNELQILKDRIMLSSKEVEELYDDIRKSMVIIGDNESKIKKLEYEKQEVEDEISRLQSDMKQLKEIKEEHSQEITNLKVKLAGVEQNKKSMHESLESLREEIKEKALEIEQNEKEIEGEKQAIAEHSIRKEVLKGEILLVSQQIEDKKQRLREMDARKLEMQQEQDQLEEKAREWSKDIAQLQNNLHKTEVQLAKIEMELENVEHKLLETYEMSYYKAADYKDPAMNLSWAGKKCEELKAEIREMGVVNVNAVEEFEKLSQRYEFLNAQVEDLTKAKESLASVITDITETMKSQFITEFYRINENFNQVFMKLFGGGEAQLVLSDMDNILESGIEIIAKPPGKKLQNLSLLSGGERALTAIALLFAILKMKPAPFCVLDEIDAALDDANVDRYAKFLLELSTSTQFIIVTHRKGTMESANCLYGVSMEDSGVSKLVSVRLEDKVS